MISFTSMVIIVVVSLPVNGTEGKVNWVTGPPSKDRYGTIADESASSVVIVRKQSGNRRPKADKAYQST